MGFGAGQLDRRVTLSTYSATTDVDGGQIEVYTVLDTVWAMYKPVRSAEVLKGGQFTGDSYVEFTIRYRSDFGVKDRISYDGTDYDVQDTNISGERKEYLTILGKARNVK